MAGHREDDSLPISSSTQTARAPQHPQGAPSPYQYQPPSAYEDGLPTSSSSTAQYGHGNGTRPSQGQSMASPSTNLNTVSHSGQHPGDHQQHLSPSTQHHGHVSPALQYPPSAPVNHGPAGSPPGHQAFTTVDSVSPPSTNSAPPGASNAKKSRRIPRACDLCSQRKVKVCAMFWPCCGQPWRDWPKADVLLYVVRRRESTL